jgi:hypothetical protein
MTPETRYVAAAGGESFLKEDPEGEPKTYWVFLE